MHLIDRLQKLMIIVILPSTHPVLVADLAAPEQLHILGLQALPFQRHLALGDAPDLHIRYRRHQRTGRDP